MFLEINSNVGLVFNQFSGGIALVDVPWWQSLGINWLDGRFDVGQLPSTWEQLQSRDEYPILDSLGFLMTPSLHDSCQQKLADFGDLFSRERQTTFFVTPQTQQAGCPLSCTYCFQKGAEPEDELLLAAGGAEAVISFIEHYRLSRGLAPEKICIQLFGGEPIQSRFFDFWQQILEAVKRNGWRWAVVTSGATLTDRYVKMFCEYAQYGLQEFNITMDGVADVHDALRPLKSGRGSHDLIVRNIDTLLEHDLPVLLKTNFGKDNIDTYPEHLDFVLAQGWHRGNFALMVNVIQPFGGVDVGEQKVSEEALMLKVIEIFRRAPYCYLIPILRLEGKKLTGYLANAFGLPFPNTEASRKGKSVFDGYPYHAFCNPTKGNSWNIAPDGTLRTCNWMDGHGGMGEGSIFGASELTVLGRYTNHVACHSHCSGCDINTLCGGGCPIDMKTRTGYYDTCRDNHGDIIVNFVRGCVERGWLDTDLGDQNIRVLRGGFDLEYKYRDRFDPKTRISDPGCLSGLTV